MVKTAVAVAPAGRTVESPRRALSPRQKLSAMRDRLVLARRQPLRGKSLKKVDIIALADEEEELITAATAPCDDGPIVADGRTMLLSATVVEFHDHYDYCESNSSYLTAKDKVDNRCDDDDGGGGDEPGSRDTFVAKLLRRIACCSPRDGSSVNEMIHEDGVTTDNENSDDRLSTIELILRQSLCEGMDGFAEPEPSSSPIVDTPTQQQSGNDNDLTLPSSDDWVHDPLLFVATSGTGMKVLGIRRVSEPSYHNSQDTYDTKVEKDRPVQLPINNGKELPSETRVIDFETNTFAGTALLRIRGSTGCNGSDSNNKHNTTRHDYFAKQNRKFQMVISGRFKSNVIMANCMSGILLDHHLATASAPGSVDDVLDNMSNCAEGLPFLDESDGMSKSSVQVTNNETNEKRKRVVVRTLKKGKSTPNNDNLPSKWALRAAVKVAGVFSPRMDADLECEHPRILSPLCSSAQTIIVSRRRNSGGGTSTRIEAPLKEPPISSESSLVKDICKSSRTNHNKHAATVNPTQQRKSLFDDMYDAHTDSSSHAKNSSTVCFDPNAEYLFEFLQHLIDYNDLSLDLGKIIGKVKLSGGLRGQPARFVSVVKKRRHENPTPDNLDFLWSFDIWHKSCT